MSFPSDTSQEFANLQLALLAMKSPNERLNIAAQLSDDVYRASRKAIARVHPEFTGEQIDDLFVSEFKLTWFLDDFDSSLVFDESLMRSRWVSLDSLWADLQPKKKSESKLLSPYCG